MRYPIQIIANYNTSLSGSCVSNYIFSSKSCGASLSIVLRRITNFVPFRSICGVWSLVRLESSRHVLSRTFLYTKSPRITFTAYICSEIGFTPK